MFGHQPCLTCPLIFPRYKYASIHWSVHCNLYCYIMSNEKLSDNIMMSEIYSWTVDNLVSFIIINILTLFHVFTYYHAIYTRVFLCTYHSHLNKLLFSPLLLDVCIPCCGSCKKFCCCTYMKGVLY